jgi:Na+/H+ antiporter NhaD/arsenite permease-like protein
MEDAAKENQHDSLVHISSKKFTIGCLLLALTILALGFYYPLSSTLLGIEVFLTVIGLFIFGSIRYRINKNALTYGAVLVISATFWHIWWEHSQLRQSFEAEGYKALLLFLQRYLLTLHGLDDLVHADTMLFILGLTLFVSVIAQTRLLETVSLYLLQKNKGWVVPTVGAIMAMVSFASGILDGVSMIGLMIRVVVMILFLAKVKDAAVLYAIMVSTIVTTVCGMWLAYGEPPNLIMKANLHPHLDNAFFLRYCLPVAVGSYLLVFWNVRKRLRGKKVQLKELDILDRYIADVRFIQAKRHGEVLIPAEFVDKHRDLLGEHYTAVDRRLHKGEPLGAALIHENVPSETRRKLLGLFLSENLADDLDQHYQHLVKENHDEKDQAAERIKRAIRAAHRQRMKSQWIGGIAFVPFVGLLIAHAVHHDLPLFYASFAGFLVALIGIYSLPRMRRLALKDARHEYMEYLFLLPLFFSITLLQKVGFFNHLTALLHNGIEHLGVAVVAYLQFVGASFLSAALDNNVVADFAGRAIHGLEIGTLHLFAMAQIAGYAAGGCWTHIGSAQSVVAYSFIRREIDPHFTPFSWIKTMTPLILEIFILMTLVVFGEAMLLRYLK